MKTRYHLLTIGLIVIILILPSAHVLAGPRSLPPLQEESRGARQMRSLPVKARSVMNVRAVCL
jgi:hypothetical protein